MLWFENARRLDSAISPKAVLRNLPKLRHNRAESMWRREGAHRTDEVSGGLDTEAAGNHRRQSGWRSYCTAGLHLLNPSLVMNHLVQYEGIVNCRLGC